MEAIYSGRDRHCRVMAILVVFMLTLNISTCGGGGSASPTGPTRVDSFFWTANAQSYQARSDGAGAIRNDPGVNSYLWGNTCVGPALNITLFDRQWAVGEFTTVPSSIRSTGNWTGSGYLGATYRDDSGLEWRDSDFSVHGNGEVRVTEITDQRMKGRFAFEMVRRDRPDDRLVINGNFDVSFHSKACQGD